MTTHLFLDLEDTLVESLMRFPGYIPIPNGILAAKNLMLEHNVVTVNIFSFALWTQIETEAFEVFGRKMLEERLGTKIFHVPNCIEIAHRIAMQLNLHPERCEFADVQDFLGKDDAFKHYVKRLCRVDHSLFRKGDQFMLLDDMVDNSTIHLRDNTVIRTILFDRNK